MPTLSIPPGVLSSRNYPGFLGALFLILLRIAIGWHFLTEGLDKVESTRYGKQPFSAEIYLRNASGPLAPSFRSMLPDPDGREVLNLEAVKASWAENLQRIESHFNFNDEQKGKVKELLARGDEWANVWFNAYDNKEEIEKYFHDLDLVEQTERNPDSMSFERERAWESRRSLEADRRKLTAPVLAKGQELADAAIAVATPEQQSTAGAYTTPLSSLDIANMLTMYGLCAIGVCLILGLLTPFSAICAAAFLAMIYLSMPPWAGLPPNPKAEGHYWIVSKNLVELIACLLIAVTASGHWLGLDAILFGARRRRRWERYERRLAEKYGLVENEKVSTVGSY